MRPDRKSDADIRLAVLDDEAFFDPAHDTTVQEPDEAAEHAAPGPDGPEIGGCRKVPVHVSS